MLRNGLEDIWNSGTISKSILSAELGYVPEGELSAQMNAWESLVLAQSAVLRAGESAAVSLQNEMGDSAVSPSPEVVETPEPSSTQPVETPAPTSNSEVTARTFLAISSTNYDQADGVYIFNRTSQTVDVAELSQSPPDLNLKTDEEGPQVLIITTI